MTVKGSLSMLLRICCSEGMLGAFFGGKYGEYRPFLLGRTSYSFIGLLPSWLDEAGSAEHLKGERWFTSR